MRFKLTILLLALNAALLGLLFYFDKVQSTQNLLDESSRLIVNPDFIQDLERIEIKGSQSDQSWILERNADQWLVSSPFQWKANPFAVEQLVFQLRRLAWESRFPVSGLADSGQSLESYNLANPTLSLALQSGSHSLLLSLGAPTEIGNRLYLLSPDGDFVYVVPRGLLDSLQRDLEAFLDRRLFSISVEETRALQIQDRSASNIRVRLERTGDNWAFVSPIETDADEMRVKTLLTDWQGLEVEGFEQSGEEVALNGNSIRLTLEGSSERQSITLMPVTEGEEAGMAYMARLEGFPTVFKVDAERVERLRSVQEDLREKRVLRRYSEDWSSLAIGFGELGLTLQRLENGSWQVLYTDQDKQLRSMPAATEAVEGMRDLLGTMEAVRFVTDAPSEADRVRFGLTEPQRLVEVRRGNQDSLEFRIGGLFSGEGETLFYASTDKSDSIFLVRPYVLSALSLDPFNYRERTIRKLPATARIPNLTLIHLHSGLPMPMEDVNSPEANAVKAALRGFVENIRVERFSSRPFNDPLVLSDGKTIDWKYLLEASVQYPSNPGETETIRLYLSERLGGTTQYVGDPQSGLVGFLPIPLIEILDDFLAEYPDVPEPPEEIISEEGMDPAP